MYREGPYRYYQPEYKVPVAGETLPDGLSSFEAFRSYDEAVIWLRKHDYNPDDFNIKEYKDNDIEVVVLLDGLGEVIPRVEDLSEYFMADRILDNILAEHPDDNELIRKPEDGEDRTVFLDRVYGEAMELISGSIIQIEKEENYNFQLYCGNPDEEWYDEPREIAVNVLMHIMIPELDDEDGIPDIDDEVQE